MVAPTTHVCNVAKWLCVVQTIVNSLLALVPPWLKVFCRSCLQSNDHNAYPVVKVKESGKKALRGIILRDEIVRVCLQDCWRSMHSIATQLFYVALHATGAHISFMGVCRFSKTFPTKGMGTSQ
jgi:hypothetical protein